VATSEHDLVSRTEEEANWLRHGQILERQHDLEGALVAYLRGVAWDEAARLLSHLGRFADAGHAMLLHLPRQPTPADRLTARQRRAAMNAALCFARAGSRREAVGLLINLGEYSKAASLLARAGLRNEAVRAMRGEAVDGNPWPKGVLFRLRGPETLATRWGDVPTGDMPQPRTDTDDYALPEGGLDATPSPSDIGRALLAAQTHGLEPVLNALREGWDSDKVPTDVTQELGEFIGRGRQAGAPAEVKVHWYAVGRLLERAGEPGLAAQAYRAVPGVLDASFRLERTHMGQVEANDGSWLPPQVFGQGLLRRAASLPDLDALFESALQNRDAYSTGSQPIIEDRVDTKTNTATFSEITPSTPSPASVPAGPAPAPGIGMGARVDGRYRLKEEIGSGGMAKVFRASDDELGEDVALKLFLQLSREGSGLDRFRREMKLSRKLLHPNIVRVLEFGVWNGARYLTMELLDGVDLERFIANQPNRQAPLDHVLQLMMQACDGLAAAHAVGVIHRDIKPGNLFVVENGRRLKVMDFGIAKVIGSSSLSITGVRVGTPRYMSPEQIEGSGAVVGPAADLYALGGVMYELLTGSPPFTYEELMPLLLNQMTETPDLPRLRNGAIPKSVEDVVMKLLEKEPEDRYTDARELRAELLRLWVALQRSPGG